MESAKPKRLIRSACLLALALAACEAPASSERAPGDAADEAQDEASDFAAGTEPFDAESLEPDLALLGPTSELGSVSQPAYDGTEQVVYVNFDGPVIKDCNGCSDATTNHSLVIGRAMGKQVVDFEPYRSVAGKRTILSKLRSWFARYHIRFTTERPAQGPYTMVVISPTYWAHHGVAPLDCGNNNKNDIAFVFRVGRSSFYTDATKIAQAAAHELGHSFGLAHTVDRSEIMQWVLQNIIFALRMKENLEAVSHYFKLF